MAAHQAPPSLGFSRQEHWSGLPLPSPIDAINNIKPFDVIESDEGKIPREDDQERSS